MKQIALVVLSILFSYQLVAQDRIYRKYATQEVHHRLLLENAEMPSNLDKMERQINEYNQENAQEVITVPVVFHIVVGPGQPFPDESQVIRQLESLNLDFNGKTERETVIENKRLNEIQKMKANAGIRFCLPETDWNGKAKSAIQIVHTNNKYWIADDRIKSIMTGGSDPWPTDKYLNVWIGNLSDNTSGYAQLPGGPSSTDGVVIDFRFFGVKGVTSVEPYSGGKTLTHLIGSYLGLYELWNEFTPCTDDNVMDTPIHNAPNFDPYVGAIGNHISFCNGTPVEMVTNFMDNSDDALLSMFTPGQVKRMRAVLSERGVRNGFRVSALTACNKALNEENNLADRNDLNLSGAGLAENMLQTWPNPASKEVNIEISSNREGTAKVKVFSISGTEIYSNTSQVSGVKQVIVFDRTEWSPGLYFVEVLFPDGERLRKTISVIQN